METKWKLETFNIDIKKPSMNTLANFIFHGSFIYYLSIQPLFFHEILLIS